jgi:L-seryl-tRNA(Ser) seleniumtransferase
MVNKTSDLLNSLPSVSELLERPPVRALIGRWNRSAVAAGVRSFLDDLRRDVERRAADAGVPSVRELAERAAKRVMQLQEPVVRPAINATGRILDPSLDSRPLADHALERVAALGRAYTESTAASQSDAAARLARLTGAEAATVVHSYSGAVWLALSALAAGKSVLVARSEVGDVEPNNSVVSLAQSARARIREVGGVDHARIADYEAVVSRKVAAILRHEPDGYRVVGDRQTASIEELVGLARDHQLPFVHALGAAPLICGMPGFDESIASVAESIATGCSLAIVRSDGLIGGPQCGIIVGHRDLVERIDEHPMATAWRLAAPTVFGLTATLELYDRPAQLPESLPIYQLLSVSLDNLRQRAERLAGQLAPASGIESAAAAATVSSSGIARFAGATLPSFAIALTPSDHDVAALDKRLRAAAIPVIGRVDGARLLLDLRSVFARQDQEIVAVLLSERSAPTDAAPQSAPAAT